MLNDQQFTRYHRQICLPEIGEEGQRRLLDSHVLIIGCGGLGSAVSLYLAAAGVGRMVLVDDDSVDLSNLQRQVAYRQGNIGQSKVDAMRQQLNQLNPEIAVRTISQRMVEAQLALEVMISDVVLDCSDNLATRQLINQVCFQQKIPLVSGAAIGWNGQFSVYDYAAHSGCYRCLYPFDDTAKYESCSHVGVIGPVVGILGNYQALAALQRLATGHFFVATNQLHLFDGQTMQWQQVSISKDRQCSVCGAKGILSKPSEEEHVRD